MIKITDITKLDIKDINVAKLKDQLLQNKEKVIQVVLGIVSFVAAISIITRSQAEIGKYKVKIATLKAKTGAIEQYNKTQNDVTDFLGKVPEPVSEDKMINLVTDLAGKNGVKIITFTPADVEKKDTMVTTSLKFSLITDSFSAMVKFMADIERGKDFMQIRSCKVDPQINTKKIEKDAQMVPSNFFIEVASIKVER